MMVWSVSLRADDVPENVTVQVIAPKPDPAVKLWVVVVCPLRMVCVELDVKVPAAAAAEAVTAVSASDATRARPSALILRFMEVLPFIRLPAAAFPCGGLSRRSAAIHPRVDRAVKPNRSAPPPAGRRWRKTPANRRRQKDKCAIRRGCPRSLPPLPLLLAVHRDRLIADRAAAVLAVQDEVGDRLLGADVLAVDQKPLPAAFQL